LRVILRLVGCVAARISRQMGDHRMQYIDYLRGEAEKYRLLAERSKDPVERQEFLDLARTCEEAARCHEELLSGG
jgi:hypothetical protein